MSNEYQLVDGSPRYGARHEGTPQQTSPAQPLRVEETAEAAARLGLNDMAAAIDRRLDSAWADAEDPVVTALRKENPEELAAARALVQLHLGSQRQWRLKAQAVRDKQLAGTVARRKASGSARAILAMRLGLMAALIAPPAYIVATDQENYLKLLIIGIICFAAAMIGGHFLTIRARIPVMPNIRGPWLSELREDVVNATLVAILQNKGVALDRRTIAAGRRGWESIQVAAKAVAALHG
ncbi:hypothetical protein B1A87_002725 [Arthrobacter sp. KBS0703]|uniref:hypothetical protein n=1 Tax=Arthrobacter sp. KBS0703 TaxID=1955698 RepID=UPI00098F7603|nr:hypothetical protein [Arthrobacter sp. KBS0703]TSE14993.1 hypothetical protein B1A87_002725 [Arthrobacter sp. KBS0703]